MAMSLWTFLISRRKFRAGAQETVLRYILGFGVHRRTLGDNWCCRQERNHPGGVQKVVSQRKVRASERARPRFILWHFHLIHGGAEQAGLRGPQFHLQPGQSYNAHPAGGFASLRFRVPATLEVLQPRPLLEAVRETGEPGDGDDLNQKRKGYRYHRFTLLYT